MQKDSILKSIILATLISLIGCQGTIIQPNSDGIFSFNIGSTEFTYTPGSRTGTMFVFNPTSILTWLNIRKADGWEGRLGRNLKLRAHRGGSYDDQYTWGEELRIKIHRDGITTVNYIFLGDPDSPGPAKVVVIVGTCDETCDGTCNETCDETCDGIHCNYSGDKTSVVEWFNSQDWSTYYSICGEKTKIVIKTENAELKDAIQLSNDNNVELSVKSF